MELQLIGKSHSRTPKEGIALNERCIKPEAVGDESVLSKRLGFFFRVCADCCKEIARDSLQFAIDVEFIDDAFDLLHGKLASAPESLCLLLAHAGSEFLEPGVGYQREMGGCMGGLSRANTLQVDDCYPAARLLKKLSGRDPGDPGSDHENVNFDFAAE
jgi:hypothetical protein